MSKAMLPDLNKLHINLVMRRRNRKKSKKKKIHNFISYRDFSIMIPVYQNARPV